MKILERDVIQSTRQRESVIYAFIYSLPAIIYSRNSFHCLLLVSSRSTQPGDEIEMLKHNGSEWADCNSSSSRSFLWPSGTKKWKAEKQPFAYISNYGEEAVLKMKQFQISYGLGAICD